VFGDEVFVGVECGGPIRGRKGDAFDGGEDGLDEVVGGRGLADDGQGPAGDRAPPPERGGSGRGGGILFSSGY